MIVPPLKTAAPMDASPMWIRTIGQLLLAAALLLAGPSGAIGGNESQVPYSADRSERIESLARRFFPEADTIGAFEGTPRAAAVFRSSRLLGYVFLTDDIVTIPAYSGKPISTLVGLDSEGTITGVEIVRHEEPILVVGITEEDLRRYVNQYSGKNVLEVRIKVGGLEREGHVVIDGISGATITVMVLNASIVRAAKQVAASRGLPLPIKPVPGARTGDARRGIAESGRKVDPVEPIWAAVWKERVFRIGILGIGLAVLTGILVFQDWFARRPKLLGRVRNGFLVYTLFFVGWYGLAQLSVINVFTFTRAIMGDFRWDSFLIDPMMFILWSFVAVTLLLWGRGVYCGWLCPYGALQELVNKVAVRLKVRQFEIPALIHERLQAIKYIILMALFAVSLQSVGEMVRYAEVEPFKTAINMHFQRTWPFVLYAVGLLAISAFNGKFFCKYLCPLGAALTIPSRFRIFDWLRRRKECGRPCQTCASECPSQAIRPTGEINSNECHYCLDCQVTYWNAYKCPPLVEKRKRFERRGQTVKLKVG